MAERRFIEPEVEEALRCIKNKENFIMTGGAGSGKTYSLVSLINEYRNNNQNTPILCITYTNNAVFEIKERCNVDNLQVSTIHDFLASLIMKFQKELKIALVDLINDNSKKHQIFRLPEGYKKIDIFYFDGQSIDYGDYYSINEKQTTISHDHLIIIAERMFQKYKKLSHILKDKAKLILIDEYQDTAREVISILLNHINQSQKECVIGFFGDSMQSIYDSGVGSIARYDIKHINKTQNRRNPSSIIELANKIRTDGLTQSPSNDLNAPNMDNGQVIKGHAYFLYSEKNNTDPNNALDEAKNNNAIFDEWRLAKDTKELWLTHKFNSSKAGFNNLYTLYKNDPVREIKRKIKGKSLNPSELFIDFCNDNLELFDNGNRGNLFQNLSSDYKDLLKDKDLEYISNQRIFSDSLLSYKFDGLTSSYKAGSTRDPILRQLDDLYEIIDLFRENNINSLLKKTSLKITSLSKKSELAGLLNDLISHSENHSIGDVLDFAFQNNLVHQSDIYTKHIAGEGNYLWNRIKIIPFKEYYNSIEYQKSKLPFATQHSIKGSEYDYVIVVLDNGKWNKYNFENIFLDKGKPEVQKRTKKLLYVCFTRAKKGLYVYMELDKNDANFEIIFDKAKDLFGEENVIEI